MSPLCREHFNSFIITTTNISDGFKTYRDAASTFNGISAPTFSVFHESCSPQAIRHCELELGEGKVRGRCRLHLPRSSPAVPSVPSEILPDPCSLQVLSGPLV